MHICDISDVEKIIDNIISWQIKRHSYGNLCSINAIFINFLNWTVPLTDYKEYLITFYIDTDSDATIDKIRQNIRVSKEIGWEYILRAFYTAICKHSYFSPLFDLEDKCVEFENCGCINHFEIRKILKSVSRLSEDIVAKNRIIFTSNTSILIYDRELKILEKRLEEFGRYDLLL